MALQLTLRVGETSAQDISLTSGGVAVLDYSLSSPDVDQTSLMNLGDGNGLSVPSWSNVTESIELHISGASASIVAGKVRSIEKLLDLARQSTTGWLDDRLYLLAEFDHDAEPWRSQVLAAKWQADEATDQIWRNYVRGTVLITRRYYWETEAIHGIEMTSGPTATPTTGYVTVYNADDTHATNRNWFQIAAAQIEGSIPAPLKLYIKNNSGGVRSARAFYIGNYVYANPTSVDPIFRAGDASGSDTSWLGTSEVNAYYWLIGSGGLTDAFKRQFGRVLVMFTNLPEPTTLLRAALQYRPPTPVTELALGEYVLAGTNYVVDLGSLPLPPGGHWQNIGANLHIALKAKATESVGDTLAVDWMQVMPSGGGRYRVIKANNNSLAISASNEVIDEPGGGVYLHTAGGDSLPVFRPFFEPIHVWPGKTQRLRLIVQGNTSVEADQVWQVKAEYRPRRITL